MAKSTPMPTKTEKYPYPSRYGSHASMVDEGMTEQLGNEKLVVCKDENGYYITEKNRLDDNCDANRYGSSDARDMKKWGVEPNEPAVNQV